ncbi:MAG: class I SAM-dependent methyltransferase [Deltaproteobacteria bacterium]|nr:class I SAM-dependent methyltransferase [Deltaproteobacteria bacterium]
MSDPRTLTHAEAKRFYDHLGAKQDSQSFYEKAALERLLGHAELEHATHVLELGCGTGKLAVALLAERLPASARYLGLDLSSTMAELARRRTAPFGERAKIVQVDGRLPLPVDTGSVDRFIATYVFDLLAEDEINAMLAEAHRVLAPGGLLCLAGLTPGESGLGRVVSTTWTALHRLSPMLVGGCRPLTVGSTLSAKEWAVELRTPVRAFGITSEVLVARSKRAAPPPP